jgi:flagellin-specific chaperone FliS
MSRQLLLGNLNKDEEKLLEVQTLLRDLKQTWETIEPAAQHQRSRLSANTILYNHDKFTFLRPDS